MRDRLIELIKQSKNKTPCAENEKWDCSGIKCDDCENMIIADHLLANGVMVQKQGKWVSAPIKDKGYDSKTIPTCTNCGYQSFITYTYCPDCGAKLKEREG